MNGNPFVSLKPDDRYRGSVVGIIAMFRSQLAHAFRLGQAAGLFWPTESSPFREEPDLHEAWLCGRRPEIGLVSSADRLALLHSRSQAIMLDPVLSARALCRVGAPLSLGAVRDLLDEITMLRQREERMAEEIRRLREREKK